MIICPNCNKEIDADSYYCDQCGQTLLFCGSCGKVGNSKHCTYCGGMMHMPDELSHVSHSPVLILRNQQGSYITGENGAVIGRREGPYKLFFEHNRYVSGVHALLKYDPDYGWMIIDQHSSNGTRVNNIMIKPAVASPLKNGDTLTIANMNLTVDIK